MVRIKKKNKNKGKGVKRKGDHVDSHLNSQTFSGHKEVYFESVAIICCFLCGFFEATESIVDPIAVSG